MNRIISEELKSCPFCGSEAEYMNYGPDGQMVRCSECCAIVDKDTKELAFEAWNTRPLATTLDLRAVPGVDIMYFLSTLRRFLEKELTSDDVSEALLFNVKLIDKHLMSIQNTGQVGRKTAMNWYYAGWELGCDKGESVNAKIAFDEAWDELGPATTTKPQSVRWSIVGRRLRKP